MTTSRVTVSVDATGERQRVEAFRRGIETAVADVLTERARQETKWGEQNHPIVPPDVAHEAQVNCAEPAYFACEVLGVEAPNRARETCDREHRAGRGTYAHILIEEVAEAIEAAVLYGDASDRSRAEWVQVAAVALAIVERIDRARAAKIAEGGQ